MRNKPLGRTGLFVSELCLGTMTFGDGAGMWSHIGALQQGEADALIGQALDAGINFLDTADIYSAGLSEQITGPRFAGVEMLQQGVRCHGGSWASGAPAQSMPMSVGMAASALCSRARAPGRVWVHGLSSAGCAPGMWSNCCC